MSKNENLKSTLITLAWSVYIPSFLLSVAQGMIIPILPGFASEEMAATTFMIGLIVSAKAIGMLIFDIPSGIILSRYGMSKTMMLGVILFALSSLFASVAQSTTFLFFARVIAGISFSLWMISRHSYIAIAVPIEIRGRAISIFGGFGRVATILGPFIGGIIAEFIGIRVPFILQIFLAIMTMIILIVNHKKSEKYNEEIDKKLLSQNKKILSGFSTVLKKNYKVFMTAGFVASVLSFLRAAREFLIPFWGEELKLSKDIIGYIVTASFAIDSLLFPLVGYVMDRWGRKFTGVPAIMTLSIAILLIPLTRDINGLLLVAILAGLGNGLSTAFILTLGADLSPKDNRGEFLGTWRMFADTGASSAPLTIGYMGQIISLTFASSITAIFGLIGTIILIFLVKDTKKNNKS
ncbi:MAG: MFS transporter [Dehalococcoidia bacterium]